MSARTTWDKEDLEYLKLLVEKHKEQTDLYYKRIGLYFTLITITITGAIAAIATGASKLNPKVIWIMVAAISFIGSMLSFLWRRIIKRSEQWLEYWKRKIYLFENGHAPDNPSQWFFIDRLVRSDDDLKNKYYQSNSSLIIPDIDKELDEYFVIKGKVHSNHNSFWARVTRVGLSFYLIITMLQWLMLVICLFSIYLSCTGFDPAS